MWTYTASLMLTGILTAGQPAGRPAAPPPYPDLSDPKAAAFSLAVTLDEVDLKTARIVYIGEDKLFLEYLDALTKTKANADRLRRAISTRYGEWASKVPGQSLQAEWKMPIGKGQDAKAPLAIVIALAKVKHRGNDATLDLTKDVEVRLKKTDAGWKVTNWPGPGPLAFLNIKIMDGYLKEFTAEVEQGKHKKVYELTAASQRILEKHTSELFKKLSPKDKGPKDKPKSR